MKEQLLVQRPENSFSDGLPLHKRTTQAGSKICRQSPAGIAADGVSLDFFGQLYSWYF